MKNRIFIYMLCGLISGFSLYSCNKKKVKDFQPQVDRKEINKLEKENPVHIYRYEQELFSISQDSIEEELKRLQSDYHFFLGDNPSVTELKAYINDPNNKRLYKQSQEKYADVSNLEKEFQKAFARIRYFFPDAEIPKIYTIISGLNYEMPIIYVDTVLIISLDMYMGSDYHFYKRLGDVIPMFIRRRLSEEYIIPDCMKAISCQFIKSNNAPSNILDNMIFEGKVWIFTEMSLPDIPDSLICGYTQAQLEWAELYEHDVWSFLINKDYLYSNDNLVTRKLMGEAPFTAYFGKKSPGNIGSWMGWQICRAWMEHNPKSDIKNLFYEKNPQTILENAKYKPAKK